MSRARPRRGALGLRGRIVGAVLIVSTATLGVAAIALLGPLENSLRKAARHTFTSDLTNAKRGFRTVQWGYLPLTGPNMAPPTDLPGVSPAEYAKIDEQFAAAETALTNLDNAASRLENKVGGTVTVVVVDQSGTVTRVVAGAPEAAGESLADVTYAFLHGDPQKVGYQTIQGIDEITAAIPLTENPRSAAYGYVLALRKPINEISGAVNAVRRAFVDAALAGLALSLLLGIPLAGRLVRRLRRLRLVALQLAAGGHSVELPKDRARDEVGDLARSFNVMQERLAHQEEARRQFVATASHELRTPLTSLEGMLELLDDDLRHGQPDLDDARSLLASARAQSRRLSRLAADLLDLSRMDAEVALRSEPIELGELSRAVLAEFDLGTSARGITTGLEEPGAPVWALGDPGSVARILRILLDNAVRVSPPGKEVTVEISATPSPTMSVRDHGPGVEESERELIFERFHRGRATAGEAGFGLGLAIGRELAERMGGALVLDPPEDGGARFTLTLPAAKAAEEDRLMIV